MEDRCALQEVVWLLQKWHKVQIESLMDDIPIYCVTRDALRHAVISRRTTRSCILARVLLQNSKHSAMLAPGVLLVCFTVKNRAGTSRR